MFYNPIILSNEPKVKQSTEKACNIPCYIKQFNASFRVTFTVKQENIPIFNVDKKETGNSNPYLYVIKD